MNLHYLAKLLLQHDDNPLVAEGLDVHQALLACAEEERLKCALSPRGKAGVAVALDQRLVVVQPAASDDAARRIGGDAVEFAAVLERPEAISSLAWLAGPEQTDDCLVLGTSSGYLQIHSPNGQLLHRQDVHDGPLVSIALRWGGMGIDPEDLSEELVICAADAVLRVPCLDVWAVVQWHAGRRERGWWGVAPAPPQLSLAKWHVPKATGPRTYALTLGTPLPSLYHFMAGRQQGPKVQVFTAGGGPPIATLEADEARSAGLLSLVSDLAGATASGLFSRAKGALPGRRSSSASTGAAAGSSKPGKRVKVPGEPSSMPASVWDEKRVIHRVSPSPCGTLAACCDNLGRVLLVDMLATVVLRMLKGYRGAQVAWLVGPAGLLHQRGRQRPAVQGGIAAGGQPGMQPQGEPIAQSSTAAQQGQQGQRGAGEEEEEAQSDAELRSWAVPWSMEDWEDKWSDSEGDASPSRLPQQAALGNKGSGRQATSSGAAAGAGVQDRESSQGAARQSANEGAQKGSSQSSLSGGDGSDGSSSSSRLDASMSQPAQWKQGQQQEQELYVVVYAPRRAAVELWQPHSGRRVAAMRYHSQRGVLLQQPVWRARQAGPAVARSGVGAGQLYEPNAVCMLDLESLQLVDLVPALLSQ